MSVTEQTATTAVRVLIAEDSPTQAERLRYVLERRGYQVTSTANGRQAMESLRAQIPTLVISDIMMPEMNGYELCQQIKSDPKLKAIPVILVTTLSDPQDVIRGLECGADHFIIKPYEERYLLSRIEFVLINSQTPKQDQPGAGVEIHFNGQRHMITADRLQILNLLLSTYEAAIERNHELTRTKDELRTANAALEASNKELEAFSYSVSHDLRAPLRAIDGFSRNLMEDYAAKLDAEGQGLLGRVHGACQRMSELIEDMLKLSKITRSEMHREPVDLTAMSKSVVAELQRAHPDRTVDVRLSTGLSTQGDAGLLRIVLENLLGNAWKFTSKRSGAIIEFGSLPNGDRAAYFIRDNGAGFDMNYAKKLFGVFQRLHSTSDFPGTGVGLATVQRIVQRHGGRIWAEGAVGNGATFFFTL